MRMKTNGIDEHNIIGKNIRHLRRLHHDSQRDLGEALGYGATTIANYESGFRMPDIATLRQIALRYAITLDQLTGEDLTERSEEIE